MPPIRIWRDKTGKFWHAGPDTRSIYQTSRGSIEAFLGIRRHALKHGYIRDVILHSRTGEEVHTRVGVE